MRPQLKRHTSIFAKCRTFIPVDGGEGAVVLELCELEALYRSDHLGEYQEECSKNLGVSRPTLTRILQSARKKVATALFHGMEIRIQGDHQKFSLAYPANEGGGISRSIRQARYFAVLDIDGNRIMERRLVENPVFGEESKGGGHRIPSLLCGVSVVLTITMGEPLKLALMDQGIQVFMVHSTDLLSSVSLTLGITLEG